MRILVATDGSEASRRAVEQAARMAKAMQSELALIHVVCTDTLPIQKIGDYALAEHKSLGDVLTAFAQEKLRTAKKLAESLGATVSRADSPFGDVAQTILDTAREIGADVIVLGKRGHGQLSGLLLGSVSQKVVSVAPCAVLVVP